MCAKGAERKLRRRREDEVQEITAVDLYAYIRPLETVTTFKHLGRVLPTSDENWPEMVANIWKAQRKWARFSSILGREEAMSPFIYGLTS